jgi:hypothetical protein
MLPKNRFGCSDQPPANNSLWGGPGFSRRRLFKVAGLGLTGFYFDRIARPLNVTASARPEVLGGARNCVFLFMVGAPSHVDTFDLKEGPWLPADFAPTSFGDLRFPQGLLPNLANNLGRLAIARSVQAWAAVHGLAQTWVQIARNPSAALGKISPNIGAVVALENDSPASTLPGFIALNASPVGAGYFPSRFAPFSVAPNASGLPQSTHPDGQGRFQARVQMLNQIDGSLRVDSPLGREAEDMGVYYDEARGLMYNTAVNNAFKFTADDHVRYGASSFGDACVVSRNVLKSNLGTRFIQIQLGGWDNHQNIYQANAGIYSRAKILDSAVGPLLNDLDAIPGVTAGKTLLDETLVVLMGEFGRTVGDINNQKGRDHFLQQFAVFAGGGVKGGRAVGKTDPTGSYTVETGWERSRPVRPEDIAATIYSALGIDWTTVRYDDPFKRGFEYVPFAASDDAYGPINALFL